MQLLSTDNEIKYSIVIGALNEAPYIEKTLLGIYAWLRASDKLKNAELILVVPPGSDNTLKIVSDLFKNRIRLSHKLITPKYRVGKGRDIKLGIMASTGEYVCFLDADGATPVEYLSQMFSLLEDENAAVVFGNRNIWSMHNGIMRNLFSGVSNLLIRATAGLKIKDSQCGFKGFSRKAAEEIFRSLDTKKWGFDIELYLRAKALEYDISWLSISGWKDPKPKSNGLAGESQFVATVSTFKELVAITGSRITGHYLHKNKQAIRKGMLTSAAFGIISYLILHIVFQISFGLITTEQPNVVPVKPAIFHVVSTFDSAFYSEIANLGYRGTGSIKHLAFYPLYPMLLHLTQLLTFYKLNLEVVAFILNGVLVSACSSLIYAIGYKVKLKNPYWAVLSWLIFPWAVFTGALYTEALFCFIVALCVYLTMCKKWYAAAIFAGLGSLTRLPGVTLGLLVLFEYYRNEIWPGTLKLHKINLKHVPTIVFLLIFSFSGILLWLGYQWAIFGSPLAFREAYKELWSYQVFSVNIFSTIQKSTIVAINGLLHKNIKSELFEVSTWFLAVFVAVISFATKSKVPKGWYVLILANLVLVVLNSNTVSVDRYIFPIIVLFPMLIILFDKLNRNLRISIFSLYTATSIIVYLLMAVRLVNFAWAG